MEFAILIYETPEDFASRGNENQAAYWETWSAYSQALGSAGVMAGGNALQGPATATTIRVRSDKRMVQDGPFADAKEQLGGFILIKAESLDEALEWAARCPAAATGTVEVRPVLAMGPG